MFRIVQDNAPGDRNFTSSTGSSPRSKSSQVEPYFKMLVPTSFIFVYVISIGEMKIRENPSGSATLAYLLVSSEPRPRRATDPLSIMTYAELQ